MGYIKPRLTDADLDLMWKFLDMSRGRVMTKEEWYDDVIPQGVSVFMKHPRKYEYMFTKDEKYTGHVDYREEGHLKVIQAFNGYIPADYSGVCLYINEDAVKAVSRHKRSTGCHA